MYRTEYDWQYETVNNNVTSQGLINGTVKWPRGKMLGGCSSVNAMVYIPGIDQDFQTWYDAGNIEWSVDDVRRCFNKAESLQHMKMLDNLPISEFYGHNGPLVINNFNNTFRSYIEDILVSGDEIGFKNVPDLSVANLMGSGTFTVTAASGVRQSTNTAYLKPIKNRANIKILKNALVTKILINENLTAYGVEVEQYEQKHTFYASKEVILSAGAVNSPQLMMLSGVGPQEHLEANNITCLIDSPMVGQNLQDHPLLPVTIYGDTPGELTVGEMFLNVLKYLENREGILAQSSVMTDAALFFSTIDNATVPELQSHITITNKNNTLLRDTMDLVFGYNESVIDSIVKLNENHAFYFFEVILLHPYSKGNISLNSNNPKDPPRIIANYFEDSRDLDTVIAGIKMVTKIVNTTFFQSINGFLGRIDLPSCNNFELDSEEYWKCICINLVTTVFHPIATCQMGCNIATSVVDSRLRVHGVSNLRVIDASVMPTLTSGNTNAPCIMIGERGAEIIKEDYNKI